ncbi:hypothetical protein FocnCong_v019814 [Fusarium oxysporum f. sp. conglutinans]|nr:hypothetical protein FocnCong_v019814 [Fusarium oxysporum f. sp. conglutinans]
MSDHLREIERLQRENEELRREKEEAEAREEAERREKEAVLRSVVFDGSMVIPIHWWLGCGCLVYSFRWL